MDWFESAKAHLKEMKAKRSEWNEKFTRRGMTALDVAGRYAHSKNARHIGVEHLLYALTQSRRGIAAKVLEKSKITKAIVTEEFGVYDATRNGEFRLPYSPRLRKVIGNAGSEAIQIGHTAIDAEHLLLALITETEGPVAKLFARLAVDAAGIRRRIVAAAKPAIKPGDT
jgi:ATP-dependent Clp protease ATP-binding subunit ClpC